MSIKTRPSLEGILPDTLVDNSRVVFIESIVAAALVWLIIAEGFGLTETISSPLLVGIDFYELIVSMEWTVHLVATLRRTVLGFLVTMVVGTILGLVMGLSNFWEKALQDYIIVGLAFPSLFAVVFAAMWFGINDITPVVAGAVTAFPFLTQSVYEAAKDIEADIINMARSFNVSRNRVIWRVMFKSILPSWFAGSRYAFSICWKITTLAELIAAPSGIGFMIERQLELRSMTGILTWTLLFTCVILVFEYGLLQQIEKRVFDWRQNSEITW